MTPQEKAKDLFDSYYYCLLQSNIEKRSYWSKQSAIIAVDEIIQSGPSYPYDIQFDSMPHFRSLKYWQEVKQEIERL